MATDIFAKIGDIKGESLDSKHKDEIEVLSWSWGVQQSGTMAHGGGGGQGKASFNDFNFAHHVDKSSPVLLKACATGEHIKSDDHGAQGWQGPAGIPDPQDDRRPHHQRQSERVR
jgi:type VI secretion system secreted protein Hcp